MHIKLYKVFDTSRNHFFLFCLSAYLLQLVSGTAEPIQTIFILAPTCGIARGCCCKDTTTPQGSASIEYSYWNNDRFYTLSSLLWRLPRTA